MKKKLRIWVYFTESRRWLPATRKGAANAVAAGRVVRWNYRKPRQVPVEQPPTPCDGQGNLF